MDPFTRTTKKDYGLRLLFLAGNGNSNNDTHSQLTRPHTSSHADKQAKELLNDSQLEVYKRANYPSVVVVENQ